MLKKKTKGAAHPASDPTHGLHVSRSAGTEGNHMDPNESNGIGSRVARGGGGGGAGGGAGGGGAVGGGGAAATAVGRPGGGDDGSGGLPAAPAAAAGNRKGMRGFRTWKRRAGERAMQRFGLSAVSCDENTGQLSEPLQKFSETKEALQEMQDQVKQYLSAVEGMFAAANGMSFLYASQAGETAKQVKLSMCRAAVQDSMVRGLKEFLSAPLQACLDFCEHIEGLAKRRKTLLLDYDHHRRKHEHVLTRSRGWTVGGGGGGAAAAGGGGGGNGSGSGGGLGLSSSGPVTLSSSGNIVRSRHNSGGGGSGEGGDAGAGVEAEEARGGGGGGGGAGGGGGGGGTAGGGGGGDGTSAENGINRNAGSSGDLFLQQMNSSSSADMNHSPLPSPTVGVPDGDHLQFKSRQLKLELAIRNLRDCNTELSAQMAALQKVEPQLRESVHKGLAACQIFLCQASLAAFEGDVVEGEDMQNYILSLQRSATLLEQNLPLDPPGNHASLLQHSLSAAVEELSRGAPGGGEVYGRSLTTFDQVPPLLLECMGFLDGHGLYVPGLFRVPGNSEVVSELRRAFDAGDDIDFIEATHSVHDVAALLKMFFRELPEPIIPFEHYHTLLEASRSLSHSTSTSSPSAATTATTSSGGAAASSATAPAATDDAAALEKFQSIARAALTSSTFPSINLHCLRLLFAFLYRVNLCSRDNRMTAENLGICFAPNLLRAPNSSDLSQSQFTDLQNLQDCINAVKLVIESAPQIFPDLWQGYPCSPPKD